MIHEPVVYEVPIHLKETKEMSEIETQTDEALLHAEVVEMPVELIFYRD